MQHRTLKVAGIWALLLVTLAVVIPELRRARTSGEIGPTARQPLKEMLLQQLSQKTRSDLGYLHSDHLSAGQAQALPDTLAPNADGATLRRDLRYLHSDKERQWAPERPEAADSASSPAPDLQTLG